MSKNNYKVGYKKPPKSTQFKKGVSGNPKGRPKKDLLQIRKDDINAIICHQLEKSIVYKEGGELKSEAAISLIIKQVVEKAARGDMKAIKVAMGLWSNITEEREQLKWEVIRVLIEEGRTDDETLEKIMHSL